jgi:hypothetical protein
MTHDQRIKADLDHFFRTGEIPEPWSAIEPDPVDVEFDARLEEMNRELDAIESGCFEPCPIGCPRPCCRSASREP